MSYVITFSNQKGGVGKTTSVHNAACGLAERGLRVMAIDADPQANLSRSAGHESDDAVCLEDLLLSSRPPDTRSALVSMGSGAWLLATSPRLATIAPEFQAHPEYAEGFGRVLAPIEDDFDVVLIDTPPGINQWSGLALVAADGIVIPAQPHDLDVRAAADTWDFVQDEVRPANPTVEVLGVLITRTQRNRRLLRESRDAFELRDMPTFASWIPAQESVAGSVRFGAPTITREPTSRAGLAYAAFVDELVEAITMRVGA